MDTRLSPEIIKKIKYIEIQTRRLLKGNLIGERITQQKGFGLEFDQLREYQPGDDVRFIDWKSTARTGKVLVKQYNEERSKVIWLLVDISQSQNYSSCDVSKRDIVAQVASVLALVADAQKDHVGLILFAADVEFCLLPKRGRTHIHEIMKQLFSYQSLTNSTSIERVCSYFMRRRFKEATVFLISDFIDDGYEKALSLVARKFDVIALRCIDNLEQRFPAVGTLFMQDIETGTVVEFDNESQQALSKIMARQAEHRHGLFHTYGIDYLDIDSAQPFMNNLIQFFRR